MESIRLSRTAILTPKYPNLLIYLIFLLKSAFRVAELCGNSPCLIMDKFHLIRLLCTKSSRSNQIEIQALYFLDLGNAFPSQVF